MDKLSAESLACFARIQASPQDSHAWSDLLYSLAIGSSPQDMWVCLPMLMQYKQNRIAHLRLLCRRLAEEGRKDILLTLIASKMVREEFLTIPRYYAARYAYIIACDLDQARSSYGALFRNFPFSQDFPDLLPEERSELQGVVRRTVLTMVGIKPWNYTDSIDKEENFSFKDTPLMEGDLMIFAACDEGYFQTYGRQFITSSQEHLPDVSVLIHLMNPTPEGDRGREKLREEFPRCNFSQESCLAEASYYAARRFMLANSVRHHYGKDLIILDIDEVMTPQFVQDIPSLYGAELGLWRNMWFDSGCSGIYEAAVFAKAHSTIADRCFSQASAWYEKLRADGDIFWSWDGYGLHYGLAKLGEERHKVQDLSLLWPDLIGGAAILPQLRKHETPTMGTLPILSAKILAEFCDSTQLLHAHNYIMVSQ